MVVVCNLEWDIATHGNKIINTGWKKTKHWEKFSMEWQTNSFIFNYSWETYWIWKLCLLFILYYEAQIMDKLFLYTTVFERKQINFSFFWWIKPITFHKLHKTDWILGYFTYTKLHIIQYWYLKFLQLFSCLCLSSPLTSELIVCVCVLSHYCITDLIYSLSADMSTCQEYSLPIPFILTGVILTNLYIFWTTFLM